MKQTVKTSRAAGQLEKMLLDAAKPGIASDKQRMDVRTNARIFLFTMIPP